MPAGLFDLMSIFERSPALTARLVPLVDPKDTPEDVVRKARAIMHGLDERELVATLNAHPRIGDDARGLSELSLREQGSQRDPATIRELAALNDEYERRFGFRCVVFVNGRALDEIARPLAARSGEGERAMSMEIRYGKTRVVFFRLARRSAPPFAASVDIDVFGERFRAAYTEGDNREVVATDTMKNFVYATAADFAGTSLEAYVAFLGRRLLETYPPMESLAVTAHEVPLDPAETPELTSDVVFRLTRGDRAMAMARFARDRDGVVVSDARSGIEGMRLLKTSGSSFAAFARDRYTTLPELADRPLTIVMDAHWRYADMPDATGEGRGHVAAAIIRRALELTFHDFNSRSIQELVHEMGQRLLTGFPSLAEVEFSAQNHTPDRVAEGKGDVAVFAEPRQTFGKIGLVLRR
jgi:urate oxidase